MLPTQKQDLRTVHDCGPDADAQLKRQIPYALVTAVQLPPHRLPEPLQLPPVPEMTKDMRQNVNNLL